MSAGRSHGVKWFRWRHHFYLVQLPGEILLWNTTQLERAPFKGYLLSFIRNTDFVPVPKWQFRKFPRAVCRNFSRLLFAYLFKYRFKLHMNLLCRHIKPKKNFVTTFSTCALALNFKTRRGYFLIVANYKRLGWGGGAGVNVVSVFPILKPLFACQL